jgi:hypothetical protein
MMCLDFFLPEASLAFERGLPHDQGHVLRQQQQAWMQMVRQAEQAQHAQQEEHYAMAEQAQHEQHEEQEEHYDMAEHDEHSEMMAMQTSMQHDFTENLEALTTTTNYDEGIEIVDHMMQRLSEVRAELEEGADSVFLEFRVAECLSVCSSLRVRLIVLGAIWGI